MKGKFISLFLVLLIVFQFNEVTVLSYAELKEDGLQADDGMSVLSEILSEEEVEKRGHCERLYDEEESLDSAVFQNSDGTKSLYVFDYPIKYYNQNGQVCNKSLELKKRNDNVYVPKQSDLEIEFSQSIGNGIKTIIGNDSFSLTPLFVSSTEGKAEISEDSKRVTYLCNDNVSLEYTLSYQGYKENIILESKPQSNSFDFSFDSESLYLQNAEERLVIIDQNKELLADIGDIIVYDSAGKLSLGEISYKKNDEGKYIVTITADEAFLSSSETVYPVYIDPSIEIDYTHMATCGPNDNPVPGIQHITLYSDGTSDSNAIVVGKKSSTKIARALMKFPALEESTSFFSMNRALIIDANVYIKAIEYQPLFSDMNVYCHRFTSKWSTSVSWNYADNYDSDYLSYRNVSYLNGDYSGTTNTYAFDITPLVMMWSNQSMSSYNHNCGIMFKSDSGVESGNTLYRSFGTFTSGGFSPYLVINYRTVRDYDSSESATITYTYRSSPMYLNAGQTYSFRTAKSADYPACDTELYLFSADVTSENSNSSWYNDDISSSNHFSRIDANITTSGSYILMAKCYSGIITGNAQYGHCDIFATDPYTQTETLKCQNAELGGYILKLDTDRVYTSGNTYDSFTANLSSATVDPVMFIVSGLSTANRKVIGFNDDYHNYVSPGDHSWGKNSRIKQVYDSARPDFIFISSYSSTSTGTGEVYGMCKNDYSDPVSFPNLKSDDIIVAAGETGAYNCIAYSGGISSNWITPYVEYLGGRLTPWHANDTETSLDNFYGNNPPRYNGATTYVVTNNTSEAVVNVYKCGDDWTHASVKKPGNNQLHGYAWESKLGSSKRIFHEYSSLNNNSYYGQPVRFYAVDNTRSSSDDIISFEESVLSGKTYVMEVVPSDKERRFLQDLVDDVDVNIISDYKELYNEWINKIREDEYLKVQSNSYKFTLTEEYKKLSAFIDENPELISYIIYEYLYRNNNIFTETLFDYKIVERNECTRNLDDSIRITNNQKCMATVDDEKYMAPTVEANFRTFAMSVLNEESYSKIIYKGE